MELLIWFLAGLVFALAVRINHKKKMPILTWLLCILLVPVAVVGLALYLLVVGLGNIEL